MAAATVAVVTIVVLIIAVRDDSQDAILSDPDRDDLDVSTLSTAMSGSVRDPDWVIGPVDDD